MNINQFLIAIVILICGCNSNRVNQNKLLGFDYRLFQNTVIWELTKAVQEENTSEIIDILKTNKKDYINTQESKYGQTLLMLSIRNRDYKSCKTLLEYGANPNIHDSYDGSTALMDAANIPADEKLSSAFLKLLLKSGADVNTIEKGYRRSGNSTRNTALINACKDVNQFISPIEKVKIIVEAGADINYKDEFGNYALKIALTMNHYDVLYYLLQKGAKFDELIYDRSKYSKNGKKVYIADVLKEKFVPFNSKKYEDKMKIVAFLKEKGIDYRKLPIPESVIKKVKAKYPNNWQEYLEKY